MTTPSGENVIAFGYYGHDWLGGFKNGIIRKI